MAKPGKPSGVGALSTSAPISASGPNDKAAFGSIVALIAELPDLDATQLCLRWRTYRGGRAPAHLPRWLLARVLAYRLQAVAYGDLDRATLRRLQPKYRDRLLTAASYWDLAKDELAALVEGPRKSMGHACEFETSMVMALRPELVRKEELKNDDTRYQDAALRGLYVSEDMSQCTGQGSVGYSELATPEKGKAFLNAAVTRCCEVVQGLLRRPLPTARIVAVEKPS